MLIKKCEKYWEYPGFQIIITALGMITYIAWCIYGVYHTIIDWSLLKVCFIGCATIGVTLIGSFCIPYFVIYMIFWCKMKLYFQL